MNLPRMKAAAGLCSTRVSLTPARFSARMPRASSQVIQRAQVPFYNGNVPAGWMTGAGWNVNIGGTCLNPGPAYPHYTMPATFSFRDGNTPVYDVCDIHYSRRADDPRRLGAREVQYRVWEVTNWAYASDREKEDFIRVLSNLLKAKTVRTEPQLVRTPKGNFETQPGPVVWEESDWVTGNRTIRGTNIAV